MNKYTLASIAALTVVLGLALLFGISFKISITNHAASQAQCESIGGRFDGQNCWYNGKVVDVNTLIKQSGQ